MARTALYLGVLAILAPWLYDRYLALSNMFGNRPGQYQELNRFKSYEIKFRDRIRNCEDVLLEPELGVALLSCDPGRDQWNTVMGSFHPEVPMEVGGLWLYDYTAPDLPETQSLRKFQLVDFKNAKDFHPLGIEFDAPTSTLYVINHAQSGTVIEVFTLNLKTATATHVSQISHPLIKTPNSIAVLGKGKLFITNDHYIGAATSPLLSKIETFSGAPGGSIVYHDVKDPSTTRVLARVPFANGITLLNATSVAVASSSKAGLYFYDIQENGDLVHKRIFHAPVSTDNISVDGKGNIIAAGHPFAPALMKVAMRRWKCKSDGTEEERRACVCDSGSWVAEWNEKTGLRELYKGYEFCSSSTAVRDAGRGVGIVSGLYERGILVFKE